MIIIKQNNLAALLLAQNYDLTKHIQSFTAMLRADRAS
jgi:hypothetical protein